MANKEATARIKINKLLEKAGWRFFANEQGQANIQLEPKVKLKLQILDALGENFEKLSNGFIDFAGGHGAMRMRASLTCPRVGPGRAVRRRVTR
jgi:hypothetical protein